MMGSLTDDCLKGIIPRLCDTMFERIAHVRRDGGREGGREGGKGKQKRTFVHVGGGSERGEGGREGGREQEVRRERGRRVGGREGEREESRRGEGGRGREDESEVCCLRPPEPQPPADLQGGGVLHGNIL